MSDSKRPRLTAAQLRPALPALAAVLVLLAAWFGWGAWRTWQAARGEAALVATRDAAVASIAATVRKDVQELERRVGDAAVRSAAVGGDHAAVAGAIGRGWAGVEQVEAWPPGLDTAFADPAASGYGKLALLQAALASGKPVAAVVRDGKAPKFALAAPVADGTGVVGVAYVRFPLARVTAPLEAATPGDDGYLALRQGSHSVLERGNAALADGAEVLAAPVPGTDWRIAAGVPDAGTAAFGLGPLGAAIGAAVFLLLAGALAWLYRRPALAAAAEAADEPAPTLAEALQREPAVPPPPKVEEVPAPPREQAVGVDRSIFRAYDIRGVVGQTLDPGVATLIGHAIGSLMHDKGLRDIVVGRDGRLSGPELSAALIEGLRKAGCNVIDLGQAATPVVYFAAYHLRTGSCVVVTGSHNPPEYNGFKIVLGGETLAGEAIAGLYARIAEDRLHDAPVPGTLQHYDVANDYVERIASDVQLDRRLRVVVDAGNGIAGAIAPRVLEAIGAEVTPLYCEVDGTFPSHHPDPSDPQNLTDLVQMVQRLDADLGLAFDGDGDRLGVVTRDGRNIFPDRLLMLFAADVLERNPGAVIVYDVKCTGRLAGHILRHGGSPMMWKTGHSLIKARMREVEAELAGEMSGHFFFKERWYGFDDAIYAAARLLEILAARPESPSEVLNALPEGVSTPEIKVEPPSGNPHAFVERFRAAARFEGGRASTMDGLRVDWPDGWGLVRASNTTPVLVLRFDADNAEALARIQAAFREQLLALEPGLKLPF
ncbi:phosphomannomutase/phosphoglucomutase [Vulcaniibacterium gelatinicum]|uniref:phosphomannomutase/phosphoglucomutase n=1 Tax=Vulcaniibacterium gelatinicum TaxID=2598725 RepID=UPI0011CC9CEC|nr:phosphomannomutase/phosphoglucomutase [Vulcaniibacterium gelatinicum]